MNDIDLSQAQITLNLSQAQIAEVARNAAELLRICGWTRGTMSNGVGEYCLVGAVHRVSEYNFIAQQLLRQIVQVIEEQYSDVLDNEYYNGVLLKDYMGFLVAVSIEDRVMFWNDALAQRDDVLLVLDKIGASA